VGCSCAVFRLQRGEKQHPQRRRRSSDPADLITEETTFSRPQAKTKPQTSGAFAVWRGRFAESREHSRLRGCEPFRRIRTKDRRFRSCGSDPISRRGEMGERRAGEPFHKGSPDPSSRPKGLRPLWNPRGLPLYGVLQRISVAVSCFNRSSNNQNTTQRTISANKDAQKRSFSSTLRNSAGKSSTALPTMVYSLLPPVKRFSRAAYCCGSQKGVALSPRMPVVSPWVQV